jgi:hypothetical protein
VPARTIDLTPLVALPSSYTRSMLIGRYYMTLDLDKTGETLEAEEPSDYVYEITGKVVGLTDAGRRKIAGKFTVFYIDLEGAGMDRVSIFDTFDAAEQTLCYYSAIFDDDGHTLQFSDRLTRLLDEPPYWGNVLVLDRVEILPKFRSHNLGLVVMRRLIERFRPGAAIVAIKPFPLQSEACIAESVWRTRMGLVEFEKNCSRASAKLRRHYAKLGFKHMRGTEFMFLFAGATLPPIADLEK